MSGSSLPGNVDGDDLTRIVDGIYLARDLINTPANDMGPPELEAAARSLAARHGAAIHAVVGDNLLTANLPAYSCRRTRRRACAAADRPHLGRSGPSQSDACRQGRVLRYRRPRHQARERHAQHEEGHGRRRLDAGARPHADGSWPENPVAGSDSGGRELDLGLGLPPARYLPVPQGPHRRDRQYRRRGPPDPRRCAWRSPTRKIPN